MTDRVFAIEGEWAVASDGHQWILMRRRTRQSGPYWHPISFVRSTRDILARCMREKGVDERAAVILLAGLPDTFDQFKTNGRAPKPQQAPSEVAPSPVVLKRRGANFVVKHDGKVIVQVVPDEKYPGMYRILADGQLSDMVNISRATDAARLSALSILNRNGLAGE